MKEKPIIFSTPMVKAILEGRKTMTRRVIKPQPNYCPVVFFNGFTNEWGEPTCNNLLFNAIKQPPGKGDILWVRETWQQFSNLVDDTVASVFPDYFLYKAGMERYEDRVLELFKHNHWRPSIHMPREAARLFLEVKSVRVERLQDISQEDARAEGVKPYHYGVGGTSYKNAFLDIWNRRNAKRGYSWDSNPWVWVIEFERVENELPY